MTGDAKYDVAISFLVADEKIASSIKAGLSGLNVFFYPHNQEELIGTNGLESMREPFLGARVNVILYRERYGKTPWTGIELSAIQDNCLRNRFESLIFVQLDKRDKKPDWLPDTHIRCVIGDFTIEEAIGAIKSKVQERGGKIGRADAKSEAVRVQQEAEHLSDRQSMLHGPQWIDSTFRPTIDRTLDETMRLAQETAIKTGMAIETGRSRDYVVVTDGRVSAVAGWKQDIFGNIEEQAYFWIREFSGRVNVPGVLRSTIFSPQPLRAEVRLLADISLARTLFWKKSGSTDHIPADELADYVVRAFLDLVSRANQGKVEMPHL